MACTTPLLLVALYYTLYLVNNTNKQNEKFKYKQARTIMDLREYLTSINVYYKLVLNLYYKLVLNLYYDLYYKLVLKNSHFFGQK